MHHPGYSLLQKIQRFYGWIILLAFVIAIKWLSFYPNLVEKYYTYGFYPVISKIQRFLFGWIPFSVGDILYAIAAIFLIKKMWNLVRTIRRKHASRKWLLNWTKKLVLLLVFIYVIFYSFWGLNYNRKGITYQLGLDVEPYNLRDLDTIVSILQNRLNYYGDRVDTLYRWATLDKKDYLFKRSIQAYGIIKNTYPFLDYHPVSIKSSLYGFAGNYIGFTGYYNPFSGEGQVKTSVLLFLQPFIACHEIAHQLGYAKENEANFVGYLACRSSPDINFRYSVYFDLYSYAINEILIRDVKRGVEIQKHLHYRVLADIRDLREYFKRTRNRVAPVMTDLYDRYLRLNNQPGGIQTYNEVIQWLIAYRKKFGDDAL